MILLSLGSRKSPLLAVLPIAHRVCTMTLCQRASIPTVAHRVCTMCPKEPSVQRSRGTPHTVTYGGLPGPAGWAVTMVANTGHGGPNGSYYGSQDGPVRGHGHSQGRSKRAAS